MVFKKAHCFLHGHIQHVGNVFALIAHLQRLPVIALAAAHVAGNIHVGEKVHLYLHKPVAGAGFAPAAPDVEGKAARVIAPQLCVVGLGKKLPYIRKHARIGGRIGAGRAPDGALVDGDDLVNIFKPLYPLTAARPHLHAVFLLGKGLIKHLVYQ